MFKAALLNGVAALGITGVTLYVANGFIMAETPQLDRNEQMIDMQQIAQHQELNDLSNAWCFGFGGELVLEAEGVEMLQGVSFDGMGIEWHVTSPRKGCQVFEWEDDARVAFDQEVDHASLF